MVGLGVRVRRERGRRPRRITAGGQDPRGEAPAVGNDIVMIMGGGEMATGHLGGGRRATGLITALSIRYCFVRGEANG